MRKGIIKEKEPQTLSRWEVIKAWIAESIASIKRSLKDGGWKGTALEAAAVTSMVGAGIVLVACVPTEVQIEKVTSESEVNRLVSANFSEEEAVREEMTKQFGALSDFEYNNGKATANVEKDGKSYAVSAEIDLGASDFEVTKYTNAELSGNNLTYTLDGQDVSENVSDKIVVEENGAIYVIDPSEALNTISIAVSDAILTENVDPENPGDPTDPENPDPENPDPDEPENPGGEDKPDPEEPDKPDEGEEDKPDPDEPDPDKPDPDEPENPGDGGTVEIKYEEYQNFDEFVLDLEGENLDAFKTAVSEALRNGFITRNYVAIFGNNSNSNNTRTYQFAFNQNSAGEIESVQYLGIKNNTTIANGTVTFTTPISIENLKKATYSGDIEEIVENGELVGIRYTENDGQTENAVTIRPAENQMLIKESDGTYSLIDYTDFISSISQDNISTVVGNFSQASPGELTETNQSYFDLCMPLAVEAGLIDADANLGFVTVEMTSGSNNQFGSTYHTTIRYVNLDTNEYCSYRFIFDDNTNSSMSVLEKIEDAVNRNEYIINGGEQNQIIISGDMVYEFPEALDGIVTYPIPAENQK